MILAAGIASALSGEFVTPLQGLRGGAWMSFTWAALGLLAYWVLRGRSAAQLLAPARWGLVLGIGLLFLHNFGRIPNNIGMDLDAHFEYGGIHTKPGCAAFGQ